MASEKPIIVTLTAEAGRQWEEKKEAIGTHGRSIVFLPRGVQPGENVRVELEEVRADARGRMMYRGRPAPILRVERWIERSGKLENLELSVDWKLQETELGVLESRPIVRRDGEARKSSTFTTDWSTSLQTARISVTTKTEIPELEEHVDSSCYGTPTPRDREMARRDGGTVTETFTLEAIEPVRSGYVHSNDWLDNRRRASYEGEPALYVRLKLAYDGDKTVETQASKWVDLPSWVQNHLSALNLLCGCRRERVDAPSGKTICSICQRELEFEQAFSMDRRVELAAQAAKLAAIEPVSKEAGEIILASSFDHVPDRGFGTTRSSLVKKSSGFAWYYFDDDGIYGSKFPVVALQILSNLALASGQALRELAAWIAGPHKPNEYRPQEYEQSYYVRSQIKGEALEASFVGTDELSSIVVAERLCGSMNDRQAALEGLERVKDALGERDRKTLEISDVLQGDQQDFGLALQKIREIEELFAAQAAGEVLVNFGGYFRRMGATGNADFWVVRPNGSRREPDVKDGRRRYEESEGTKSWNLVEQDELAISWEKMDTRSSHSFKIGKLPAGGLTTEQRVTVAAIEEEILESYQGMSGKESPALGRGWGFGPGTIEQRTARRELVDAPTSSAKGEDRRETNPEPVMKSEPVDLSRVDLSKLFGGGAKQRR